MGFRNSGSYSYEFSIRLSRLGPGTIGVNLCRTLRVGPSEQSEISFRINGRESLGDLESRVSMVNENRKELLSRFQ